MPSLHGRRFVIDGTNVTLLHGRVRPELRYVLALCGYLGEQGATCVCYFDANTRYILEEHGSGQLAVFLKLTSDPHWSMLLQVVPSGTEADEWILRRAKSEGAEVISNDKYRSRARDHRWIWKRRHPLVGERERLRLPTLGLDVPVAPGAVDYLPSS